MRYRGRCGATVVGKAADEPWYRVELPDAMMPSATEVNTFDLANANGIRLVINVAMPHPMTLERYYRTLDVMAGSGQLAGILEITGVQVAKTKGITDAGEYVGVGFDCEVTQTITLPDPEVVLKNFKSSFGVGALAVLDRDGIVSPSAKQ